MQIVFLSIVLMSLLVENNLGHIVPQTSNRCMIPILRICDTLDITIQSPKNNSQINDYDQPLFRLTGSLDKIVFYCWSTEKNNQSIIVLDEFFVIQKVNRSNYQGWVNLYVYASKNSSDPSSQWIKKTYSFYYDNKNPSFSVSHKNDSTIEAFTELQINFSEPVFDSQFRWDDRVYETIPDNSTMIIVNTHGLESGHHNLTLEFYDGVKNSNISVLEYNILFGIRSDPINESRLKTGVVVILEFSDPYNALYSWDDGPYSGYLDPTPAGETNHTLHVKVEVEIGVYEVWNFTYLIDNTPINININPLGGAIPAKTNLSITLDEIPLSIGIYVNNRPDQEIAIHGNKSKEFWVIMPEEYGLYNITISAEDEAHNLAELQAVFNISLSVITIYPTNNSYTEQDNQVNIQLNAEEWRTVLFNIDDTPYNTTYNPTIPASSGVHYLKVYLEDMERRWTQQYFQWYVRPFCDLMEYDNGSNIRTDYQLDFYFKESLDTVIYHWGNDSEVIKNNVENISTGIYEWSNNSQSFCQLTLKLLGQDNIWKNVSYIFVRDDINIGINVATSNNSIINAPFTLELTLSELPYEVVYSWDGLNNLTIDNLKSKTLEVEIPRNMSSNPHKLDIYVSDSARNWNHKVYYYHTGTGVETTSHTIGSRIRGGDSLVINLTVEPLELTCRWLDDVTGIPITNISTLGGSKSYNIPVPTVNNKSKLELIYKLDPTSLSCNETLSYTIDSKEPQLTLKKDVGVFGSEGLIDQQNYYSVNLAGILNLTVQENLSQIVVWWNNNTILFNQSLTDKEYLTIQIEEVSFVDDKGNLTVLACDMVNNNHTYYWRFVLDTIDPVLQSKNLKNNGRFLPNTTLSMVFNESIRRIEVRWFLNGDTLTNETLKPNSTTIALLLPLEDGKYTLKILFYDMAGNSNSLELRYTVDGTCPKVNLDPTNGSIINSNGVITIKTNEEILNTSYYHWGIEGTLQYFQSTSIELNRSKTEGLNRLVVYVVDLVGNNHTYLFVYTIDNTAIDSDEIHTDTGGVCTTDDSLMVIFFPERPVQVLASWNGGTNESLIIGTKENVRVYSAIQETAGSNAGYYAVIELPDESLKEYKLVLYIKDEADNWSIYTKKILVLPSPSEIVPVILLVLVIVAIIGYTRKDRIKSWINNRLGKKDQSKGSVPEKATDDKIAFERIKKL